MSTPQPGIFALGTISHYHLELDRRSDVTTEEVAAAVRALRAPSVTSGGSNLVVGFGADLWREIAPGEAPAALVPFTAIEGAGRRAPATQHDVWVWVHGTGPDVLLDNARAVAGALAPVATLAHELACFVYHDGLDLTGFIDGTENPAVHDGPEVATVPAGEPGAGGSFAIAMQWVHDLDAFGALPVPDQEQVIGRTKPGPTASPGSSRSSAGASRGGRWPSRGCTSSPSLPIRPGSTGCWRGCSEPPLMGSLTV